MAGTCRGTVDDTTKNQLNIEVFDAPGLGDRSYLVHDANKALVVDAQREPGPYLEVAARLGLEITLVLETHVHNDYVSGGLALSRLARATYGVPAGEVYAFRDEYQLLDEGDKLAVGELDVMVLATPGHTAHHLSFLVRDSSGGSAVLTGGSLLAGATGRTDLLGAEHAAPLAKAQWASVRRLLADLEPSAAVLPTHGFGSFCSIGPVSGVGDLTIANEQGRNPAALLGLEAFVASLTTETPPVPAYYRHMAPINRSGAAPPEYDPVPMGEADALPQALSAGLAVIDLRPRRHFAAGHRKGALNIELGPNLSTYLGWLVPFEAPVVFIAPSPDDVVEAQHVLARIGRENVEGWFPADLVGQLAPPEGGRYQVCDFEDLARRSSVPPAPYIMDIRFGHEWGTGHIRGARHVPLPEVGNHLAELPRDQEIWVHCAGGFRAAIASSMLSAQGLCPVLLDDALENAAKAGLVMVGQSGVGAGATSF